MNMLQVAIIPCKPSQLFSFLQPLFDELKQLESDGISVLCDDGNYFAKAHLILATGDIPAVAELIHHSGHNSFFGCRQCKIKGISEISPGGKGTGRYFKGSLILDEKRKINDFLFGDPVSKSYI